MDTISDVAHWILQQEQLNEALIRELRETAYIVQGYAGMVPESTGEVLESVRWRCQKSLDRLERLVQSWELLQTNLYRNIELKKIRVDLKALAMEEAEKCAEQTQEEHISFSIKGDSVWILGDEDLLRLMLQNLYQHILCVIPAEEKIKVDLWMDDAAVLQIKETGYGISERERAFLLGNLIVDTEEESIESNTSIDLAAAGIIARKHGGTIEVDTLKPNYRYKGTCYTFTFPLSEQEKCTREET